MSMMIAQSAAHGPLATGDQLKDTTSAFACTVTQSGKALTYLRLICKEIIWLPEGAMKCYCSKANAKSCKQHGPHTATFINMFM